jgi:hypothetical protein
MRADRVGNPLREGVGAARSVEAERQPGERAGETDQRAGQERCAAPVHGDDGGLAGHLLERGTDRDLERMVGVAIGPGVPVVDDTGGQHRGVLAGAVHQHRRLGAPLADDGLAGGVVERIVGWGQQGGLIEAHAMEDAMGALDVEVLT